MPYSYAAILLLLLAVAPQPSTSLYHTSSEILHWFGNAAKDHPGTLKFRTLADKQHVNKLYHAAVTNYAKGNSAARKQVMFVFGEHAREVITSEVGLWFGRLLVKDTQTKVAAWPELHSGLARVMREPEDGWEQYIESTIDQVLSKLVVQLVPIESLAARRTWEGGALCQRKTNSNVDLNRNWPFAWKQAPSSDEQYGGPTPLSEPESRLLRALLLSRPTLGYVNVHSGEWALYTPWDSKDGYAPGLPEDLPKLVSTIGTMCNCKAGPAGSVSGYLAFGSSMDFAYTQARVPYPLTVEVYGGEDYGKLRPGEKNKPLTQFPLLDTDGNKMQQQQQQQEEGQKQPRRMLAAPAPAPVMYPQQQQQQQQQQHQHWQQQQQFYVGSHGDSSQPSSRRDYPTNLQQQQQGLDQEQLSQQGAMRQLQRQSEPSQDALLELVAKATQAQASCFAMYNPGDEATYRRVVGEWLAIFLVSLQHMAQADAGSTP